MTAAAYKGDSAYIDRHILGLPYEVTVYDSPTGKIVSTEIYQYDWGGNDPCGDPYLAAQAPSVNYDAQGYPFWFVFGRGNLNGVMRFDCTDNTTAYDDSKAVWVQRSGYDMAGSVVWTKDPGAPAPPSNAVVPHRTTFSYADSFSDTSKNGLNTLGYPTAVTDAEGYTATVKYDYTTGAPTETNRPSGGGQPVTYETHSLLYDWTA